MRLVLERNSIQKAQTARFLRSSVNSHNEFKLLIKVAHVLLYQNTCFQFVLLRFRIEQHVSSYVDSAVNSCAASIGVKMAHYKTMFPVYLSRYLVKPITFSNLISQ